MKLGIVAEDVVFHKHDRAERLALQEQGPSLRSEKTRCRHSRPEHKDYRQLICATPHWNPATEEAEIDRLVPVIQDCLDWSKGKKPYSQATVGSDHICFNSGGAEMIAPFLRADAGGHAHIHDIEGPAAGVCEQRKNSLVYVVQTMLVGGFEHAARQENAAKELPLDCGVV